MDTVNKVVDAASKAIWGENAEQPQQPNLEQHEEPVAGLQGKGTATDPYDGGNREEQPGAPSTNEETVDKSTNRENAQQENSSSNSGSGSGSADPESPSNPGSKKQETEQRSNDQPDGQSSRQKSESSSKSQGKESVSGGDDDYEAEPDVNVSEEALKGPKTSQPRPEFEFEKQMEGKPSAYDNEEKEQGGNNKNSAKKNDNSHGAQGKKGIAQKMKDKLHLGKASGTA